MKLTFVGTRGEIEARTRRHHMHTSLMASYRGREVMIDCGLDWLGKMETLRPAAVVLTHAHPDHAWGLRNGAPCAVYATEETWDRLRNHQIQNRNVIAHRTPTEIGGIVFEAFSVEHSIRAPAVGYRITAGRSTVFYAPDLVYIHQRREALSGVSIYIGDGATITRPMIRRRGKALIGHAPIGTQLAWCQREDVPRAVITHCGSAIVTGDERIVAAKVRALGQRRGVDVRIAFDGMAIILR